MIFFFEVHLEMQSSPLPTPAGPTSNAGCGWRSVRIMQNRVLLVCLQWIGIAKEQKSFKPKLAICFLCLEKYTVGSPNRGILHQELNFAFAPQELESHAGPGSNVKKARTCQKEFTVKGESFLPRD